MSTTFDEHYHRNRLLCNTCLAAKATKRRRKLANKLRSSTSLERKGAAFSWLTDINEDDLEIALIMLRNEQLVRMS